MIVYTYLGQDLMPNSLSWDCEGFFWTIIPRFDEEEEEEAIKEKKNELKEIFIYIYALKFKLHPLFFLDNNCNLFISYKLFIRGGRGIIFY